MKWQITDPLDHDYELSTDIEADSKEAAILAWFERMGYICKAMKSTNTKKGD